MTSVCILTSGHLHFKLGQKRSKKKKKEDVKDFLIPEDAVAFLSIQQMFAAVNPQRVRQSCEISNTDLYDSPLWALEWL